MTSNANHNCLASAPSTLCGCDSVLHIVPPEYIQMSFVNTNKNGVHRRHMEVLGSDRGDTVAGGFFLPSMSLKHGLLFGLLCVICLTVSLCCSGWPRTLDRAQGGLQMTATLLHHLPNPGITGLRDYFCFPILVLKKRAQLPEASSCASVLPLPRQGSFEIQESTLVVTGLCWEV